MKNKNHGRNGKSDKIPKNLLERFPSGQQDEIRKIWQKSGQAHKIPNDSGADGSNNDEREKSLLQVHRKLGLDSSQDKRNGNRADSNRSNRLFQISLRWGRYLAAALILIVIGAGWFIFPKSITVPYGEVATVDLPDGTQVVLNSGSALWHNRLFGHTNRTVHLDGEGYFRVESAGERFKLVSNDATIEVTGTEFNVRSWSSDPGIPTDVSVKQGEVRFFPTDTPDRAVILSAGTKSSWQPVFDLLKDPEPADTDQLTAWRDNLLIFNEAPLIVILRELERKYNSNIELEVPEVALDTLTTYYTEQRDLETVLKDITVVKGLQFAETATGYRLYQDSQEE